MSARVGTGPSARRPGGRHGGLSPALTSLICALLLVLVLPAVSPGATMSPRLEATLATGGPTASIDVIVKLKGRPNLTALLTSSVARGRRPELAARLRAAGRPVRDRVLVSLRARGATRTESLWIMNGIAATVPRDVVNELLLHPDVASMELDFSLPVPEVEAAVRVSDEWNVRSLGAPALWGMGLTGTGVVVGTMDSGVDINHPDLGPGWRGGTNSWFDPHGEHATPFDASGHGTAVMGLLAGGDASGSTIGLAPDSQWIAVKIFDDAGNAPLSSIHLGFQWLLDPDGDPLTDDAPHVVSNSWGFEGLPGVCDAGTLEFQPDVQALRAAGISVVFAAGNGGPAADTSVSPGNYPETLSAGSVQEVPGALPEVTLSSSRGPSACDGGIFPDLVAPGAGVRTADLTLGGSVPDSYTTVAGTSFAAPHVAGAIALLRDAYSASTAGELEQELRDTAVDLGWPGPDDESGYGFVDVLAAYASRFVPSLYRDILMRPGGPAGRSFWEDQIVSQASSRAGVTGSFFGSVEYDGVVGPVARLYRSAYGRFADRVGLTFWRGRLAGGDAVSFVAEFFAGSGEFQSLYGSPTNEDFVRIIYQNMFARQPTASELSLWGGKLNSGALTRGQVLAALSENPEHIAVSSPDVLVTMCFVSLLQRTPDSGGFDFWVSFLEGGGSAEGMIEAFLRSAEYQTRF